LKLETLVSCSDYPTITMNRTRRRQPQPLNAIESLLLAQAVWQHGAAQPSWSEIAKILSHHPLLSRPKSFFNPQVSLIRKFNQLIQYHTNVLKSHVMQCTNFF
jgi:hypothetical protein